MCIAVFTLDVGLLARSQYSEGPANDHLDTGFSRFPCVYKQMVRWFPTFQVATTCFSCSPPDLNLLDSYFIFMYMHYNHCHRVTAPLQLNILLLLLLKITHTGCYVVDSSFSFVATKRNRSILCQICQYFPPVSSSGGQCVHFSHHATVSR